MGNTTVIDEVVDPIAVKQFQDLTTASKAATDSMVAALKVAIELNAATGGSTAATFAKNAKASTDATDKLIKDQQRVIDIESKKAAAQEAAYNKYLILLSKQQAEREKQDAKEIALAEKKAAKLLQIQQEANAKADAESARKANRQFPSGGGSTITSNIDKDDSPAVRNEPVITGNENMVIANNKITESVNQETISYTELELAIRRNIKVQLELEAELAGVRAEMKLLNTENTQDAAKKVTLTASQLELTAAISQNKSILNQQTKEQINQVGSGKALNASLAQLRLQYESLSVAERDTIGVPILAEINKLDAETKKLSSTQGVHNKEVGNYALAQNKATKEAESGGNAFSKAGRSIGGFIAPLRQLAYILPGIGLAGIFNLAFEALAKLISQLDLFDTVLTATQQKQKAMADAFAGSQYSTAVENIQKLGVNLDLAKNGFADSNTVIEEYNETIGKTAGYVDTLKEAQEGFIRNAPTYIDMVTKEAAAQLVLAENAKLAAETEVKNQKLRNDIEDAKNNTMYVLGKKFNSGIAPTKLEDENNKSRIERDQKQINDNNKKLKESMKNGSDAAEALLKQRNADQEKLGGKAGGKGGQSVDPLDALQTQIANIPLERQKIISQQLLNNEKITYSTRIQAANDFFKASEGILKNNEALALKDTTLSKDQQLKIEGEYQNSILQLQQTRDSQTKSLVDKQYKQDQEILKNDLTKQRDLAKSIIDDPNISFDAKIAALKIYQDRSLSLITTNYGEQKREAGKNSESLKLAKQAEAKSELELTNEVASETLKIRREALQKILSENENAEKLLLQGIADSGEQQILAIQTQADKELAVIADKYKKRLITEKQFKEDQKRIQDQADVDKAGQDAFTAQSNLEIRQAVEDKEVSSANKIGATPEQIQSIKANSGVGAAKKAVTVAGQNLNKALTKQNNNDAAPDAKDVDKKEFNKRASQLAIEGIDEVKSARDAAFEAQISQLEAIGKQIDKNAIIEKDAVNNSLDTNANKARRIAIIDAQTASQKEALQKRENDLKHKRDVADKEATIAKLIIEGRLAVITALTGGPVLGQILAIASAALVAGALTTAIATPLPTYFKGTGTGSHPGGLAIYGEMGRELIEEPGRLPYYSPGVATIANLPKGTKITPHNMLPETPKWTESRSDNRDVVDAVKENTRAVKGMQQTQKQPKLTGWVAAQRQADAWASYSTNHFR